MIIINVEPGELKSTKHLCYYTEERGSKLGLYEVYEATYPQPQAPEHAVVVQIETRLIKEVDRARRRDIAEMELLENSQHAVRKSITK